MFTQFILGFATGLATTGTLMLLGHAVRGVCSTRGSTGRGKYGSPAAMQAMYKKSREHPGGG
jgi:hypothetical protein